MKTRAERIKYAVIELEGTTLQKVEQTLRFTKGQLSRWTSGKRGAERIDVDMMTKLANHLHVEFDWLVRGVLPVRAGGRDTSPFEEAMVLARRSGTREEAIQSAWARFQDRQATMTALEWAAAIHGESVVLERVAAQSHEPIDITALPRRVDKDKRLKPKGTQDER
jgi:transcriptional regulator with XRE-family HTH domain